MTRVFPHQGNRRFIVPNRLGQAGGGEQSSLFVGLQHQADVNTDGRADDAPFDHISSTVMSVQNAPTVAAGDGGYDGLQFFLLNQTSAKMVAPAIDYTLPFTMACRAKTLQAVVDNATLALGLDVGPPTGPLLAMKITRDAAADAEAFLQADNGQFTIVQGTLGGNDDGVEHVYVCRSLGGATGRVQLTIDQALSGDVTGNYVFPTTIDNLVWGAFFIGGAFGFWGTNTMQWTAVWDRLITNDEIIALTNQDNPFGRSP